MSLGGLYLEGLIHAGAYFRNFTVSFPTRFLKTELKARGTHLRTTFVSMKNALNYVKYG